MKYILTLEKHDELSNNPNSNDSLSGTEITQSTKKYNGILYHGSNWKFNQFDINKIGRNTDSGWYSKGIYFTKNQSLASYYGVYVYECVISLSNPYYSKSSGKYKFKRELGLSDNTTPEEVTDFLLSKGFDGVIILNSMNSDIIECVVYDPKNIRIKNINGEPVGHSSDID